MEPSLHRGQKILAAAIPLSFNIAASSSRSPDMVSQFDIARPPGQNLDLTKIDAAEAQLRAAVRMFFEDWNLVPVFTLANAVREMVGQLGEHLDIDTVQKEIAKARGITVIDMVRPLTKTANFLKHADRDPAAKIELGENDVEVALFFACHDFGRVTGGMPIEAQVLEAWVYAAATKRVSDAPLRRQRLLKNTIAAFPGLRRASSRSEQKKIGLQIMEEALRNKSLEMTIMRQVPAKAVK